MGTCLVNLTDVKSKRLFFSLCRYLLDHAHTNNIVCAAALLFLTAAIPVRAESIVGPQRPICLEQKDASIAVANPVTSRAQTPYDCGDPTAAEQFVLEMINRARSNPTAEGTRLGIDIKEGMKTADAAAVKVQPPLAMNKALLTAARAHSQDMYTKAFFAHNNLDGKTPGDRITAAGYTWTMYGENIATGSSSSEPALEDLLMLDTNYPNRGHRVNLLDANAAFSQIFREIGLGVYNGATVNTSGYKNFLTQDFGNSSTGPFLVGVVYQDKNINNFYDAGEGISGVTVTPTDGSYYAVTSTSGGYAFPVGTATSGTLSVTISGGSLPSSVTQSSTLTGNNLKLDFLVTGGSSATLSANAQSVSTTTDTAKTIILTGSGATSLTYAIVTQPSHGTLSGLSSTTGAVIYTPTTGYTGSDTFTFTVASGSTTSSSASVSITISNSGSATATTSATLTDTDSDGFPDEMENWLGTSPNTADSNPASALTFGTPSKLSIKLNFAKSAGDSINFSYPLGIAAGYQVTGRNIAIDIGGVMEYFILDSKGKSTSTNGSSFQFRARMKNGVVTVDQAAKVTVKLVRGDFAGDLADEGIENGTVIKKPIPVPIVLVFFGSPDYIISGNFTVSFSAKSGRSGSARGSL